MSRFTRTLDSSHHLDRGTASAASPIIYATPSSLCVACGAGPKYFDGTKTHPYCSKACAAEMKNICDHCHQGPKYNDGKMTHPFCSKTCARQATGVIDGGVPAPSKNGCLLCGKVAMKGHFCSQACTSEANKNAPSLLEIRREYDTFKSVAHQFRASWRHQTPCPTVRRVYKIIGDPASTLVYEEYRASVEARGKFVAAGRSPGNENRRWHGTTRECLLGDDGDATLCSSSSCSLCSIIRASYKLDHSGTKFGWARFGDGIYTSSTSSKCDAYTENAKQSKLKAMLLNKVVVGKGYKITQDRPDLTAPPPGYDSILGEVVNGGSLNYDELVCYTEDAIRPSYLVIYDACG